VSVTTPPKSPARLRMDSCREILHSLEAEMSCASPTQIPVLAARIAAQSALLNSYTMEVYCT